MSTDTWNTLNIKAYAFTIVAILGKRQKKKKEKVDLFNTSRRRQCLILIIYK